MCPHTAIGHMAMDAFAEDIDFPFIKVTVATAHPAKFADSVERILREDVPLPPALAAVMDKTKRRHVMEPSIENLSEYLDANA